MSEVKISDSILTFDSVYKSEYAPKDEGLKKANLLFIPYHNYRPGVEYCFGENSEEFLRYLRTHDNDIKPDIAIEDDKYQSMEMHSLLIDIGIILVKDIILPAVSSVLAAYVYDKIKSLHQKSKDVNIRIEIVTQDKKGKSKSIKYDGPATDFNIVERTINKVLKQE